MVNVLAYNKIQRIQNLKHVKREYEKNVIAGTAAEIKMRMQKTYTQDGFIHIAASGWISVNTEEKENKHYIQKVKKSVT